MKRVRNLWWLVPALALLLVPAEAPILAGKKSKPLAKIGSAKVTPKKLPGTGGNVQVTVKISTAAGATLQSVDVSAELGVAGSGPRARMTPSGSSFVGTLRLANLSPNRIVVPITVHATVSSGAGGNEVVSKRVGAVKIDAYRQNPDFPPPPPF